MKLQVRRRLYLVICFGVATCLVYALDMLLGSGGRMGWAALLYAMPLGLFHAVTIEIEVAKSPLLRATQWGGIALLSVSALVLQGLMLGGVITLFLTVYTWVLHLTLRDALTEDAAM